MTYKMSEAQKAMNKKREEILRHSSQRVMLPQWELTVEKGFPKGE